MIRPDFRQAVQGLVDSAAIEKCLEIYRKVVFIVAGAGKYTALDSEWNPANPQKNLVARQLLSKPR